MKFLIVGDAGSIFIKQYIEYVLLDNPENEIVLISEHGGVNPDYIKFYLENDVIVEPLWNSKNNWLKNIPKIRSVLGVKLWCKYISKKYKHFDCIHVHGLNYSRGNIGYFLRKSTNKLVVSVWGDEIFRADSRQLNDYKKYYNIANVITVSTQEMLKRFISVYGELYSEKICMNKFAIGLFDYIEKYKQSFSREELNSYFGIKNYDKINVFVGFNGRSAQRHFEILESLENLPKDYFNKINLIFTMTYGVIDTSYIPKLEAKAKQLGCSYVILHQFLNEIDMAKLRCVCDILIHAQLTDAFSASIQESLFAGCIVLTGDWLPYSELPNWENFFVLYSSFEDLTSKLKYVLDNYELVSNSLQGNKIYMYNMSSRKSTTIAWKNSLS